MATNRREALKKVALLGAAVGIGTASRAALAGARNGASETKENTKLLLYGRHWRISSQDLQRGELPAAGVRMLARGEIVDKASRGRKIGDFFATYYRLSTSGKAAPDEPGSLELHTFVFADGTIVGTGTAPTGIDHEGHFAVVGGTGRYQGARGSYVARQSHADLGGDGTAAFTFTLI